MFENYKKQIELSKNKRKFTIPKILYKDPNYCKERLNIILIIANIFEKNKEFKKKNKQIQDKIIIDIEESCYTTTIKKANEERGCFEDETDEKSPFKFEPDVNRLVEDTNQVIIIFIFIIYSYFLNLY